MLFSEFSKFCQQLEETASRLTMTEVLSQLFKKSGKDEIDKICYLLQGRVAPLYEKREFGLAERLVLKAFINAFSLDSSAVRKRNKQLGDLGLLFEEYKKTAKTLFPPQTKLTIIDVFLKLDKLSRQEGIGSQEAKLAIIAELLEELDPLSCRYLGRILLGKLRLGLSDMTILDAFSWMVTGDKSLRKQIERAYNVRPDLGLIGKILKQDGIVGLKNISPKAGVPILMTRAERVGKPEDILDKIGKCAIEPKYDGLRMQIHILSKQTVKIFSRNLEDVSYMYPDLQDKVRKALKVKTAVIEGEAVGYNPKTGKHLPFQETVQRKRKYGIDSKIKDVPLKLFVFDLLLVDDKSFLNAPYTERKEKLRELFRNKGEKNNILVIKEEVTDKIERIEALFQDALKNGLEGIMAKKLDAKYEAGARGWSWIKFKHSYSAKVSDTIDCLVMGYDLGRGKRSGFGIGAFLVGVYDQRKDNFVTVAKIGTGLTDTEWKDIRRFCDNHKSKIKPKEYVVAKQSEPDIWVAPHIVVEIKADEITKSPVHSAKLALRFPRMEKIRIDKTPTEVTTLNELQNMFKSQTV